MASGAWVFWHDEAGKGVDNLYRLIIIYFFLWKKYVVFGPIILFFGFFLLLIIGFFAFIGKLFIKGKNQAWIGEVIDKVVHEEEDDDTHRKSRLLSLKVKLENGEVHSIPARVDFYNKVKVGDKLEKKKGALWPEII